MCVHFTQCTHGFLVSLLNSFLGKWISQGEPPGGAVILCLLYCKISKFGNLGKSVRNSWRFSSLSGNDQENRRPPCGVKKVWIKVAFI